MSPRAWSATLILAVIGAFSLSVWLGSVDLTIGETLAALAGRGDASIRQIVVELRAPRAVLAILVGGGLALAGAVFQALLRNPLAEPYILGISGGAATGAVLALAFGLAISHSWALPIAAFVGALLAITLVLKVAAAADGGVDVRVTARAKARQEKMSLRCMGTSPVRCSLLCDHHARRSVPGLLDRDGQ